jgi:hypothetical protein
MDNSPPPSYLLFFGTLLNKLKVGVQNGWETTTHSKPPIPIIMIDQLEIGSSSHITISALLFFGRC